MNIDELFNNGGYLVPNPNYNPKSKKNTEPQYLKANDLISMDNITNNSLSNLFYTAAAKDQMGTIGVNDENDKYIKYGITPTRFDPTLDKQLAEAQSAGEKFWNGAKQAVVSEMLLGTFKSIGDIYDIITGAAFEKNNDYQNAYSAYFEKLQEEYNKHNAIYTDPNVDIFNGGLTDAGWWASNMPSIMSSLTLLIPSTAVVKGASYLGKASGLFKGIGYTRKALTGAKNIKTVEDAAKLGTFAKWVNSSNTITATNRMAENFLTAAVSRTLENYQEGRQVYNDMYQEASNTLREMTDTEYQSFLDKNSSTFENANIDVNNRDEVAKYIASNAADKTFKLDYLNMLTDVAQVYALRNPLKLSKNMRATAATRKAERLAKRYAGKNADYIIAEEAKRTFAQKAKDFVSDNIGAYKVVSSELGEGLEEGINYIAQEEGMHYGRSILNPDEHVNDGVTARISSYLTSPQLYESAFWGVLGGVVFQEGGSAINRSWNATERKRKADKETNETTKEGTKLTWSEAFETAENKRRVAEIKSRELALEKLGNRLNMIDDANAPKDPFTLDPNNPSQNLAITSDVEKEVARKRAIEEFITELTFNSIDAGNFDTLKAYLRDENVRKVLAEKGIIENTGQETDVESLIAKMDEVEQTYNDNLIAINGMSAAFNSDDLPFEYIQIIGRDNAKAQLHLQQINNKINAYESSAENNKRRFSFNLDTSIDYKSAVDLVVSARRLGMLKAKEKEILNNETYAKSVNGQIELKKIKEEIKSINDRLYSDAFVSDANNNSFGNKMARVLWANGVASQGQFDTNGKYFSNKQSDGYVDYLDALIAKDVAKLSDITGIKFEATDEDLVSLFGDTDGTGAYDVLSYNLSKAFDLETGLQKLAPNLNEDYQILSSLNIAKLDVESNIANTTDKIYDRINELHNSMNEARVKAINESESVIFELGKQYGYTAISDAIFNNAEIENITDTDNNKLKNALEILNLASTSNVSLGHNLNMLLFLAEHNKVATETIENQENTTNQQANTDTQSSQLDDTTVIENNSSDGLNLQENQANLNTSANQQFETKTSKLTPTIDGTIAVDDNVTENDFAYTYYENENGDIIITGTNSKGNVKSSLENESLYDNVQHNNTVTPKVQSYPILTKNEQGKLIVKEKGQLNYEAPINENATNSTSEGENTTNRTSTGEVDNLDTSNNTNSQNVEQPPIPILDPEVASQHNKATEEGILKASVTDELIEDLEDKIMQESRIIFSNRDKSIINDSESVSKFINETIKQQLQEAHAKDDYQDVVQNAINRAIKLLTARATRSGLIKSAAEVLSSSVTETPNGRFDFSQEYKDAVNNLINDFCKEYAITDINGKKYISLENVLRRVNSVFNDKHMADSMYKAINAYLKTKEATDKYIIIDNTDSSNFLENVKKTAEERRAEQLGEKTSHRVFIDDVLNSSNPKVLEVFDSIEKGSTLQIKIEDGIIKLTKNNVVIGTMPGPKVNSENGRYYQINKGWRTEVGKENGVVTSNLKQIFEDILFSDDSTCKQIFDSIMELNYGKPTTERKTELINSIYDKLNEKFNVVNDSIIDPRVDKDQVVEHIANLWKYFESHSDNPDQVKADIATSLDLWFEKLYNDYSTLANAVNTYKDGDEVLVTGINSGELIKVVPNDEATSNDYDKYTQSNKAFANADEVEVGVVVKGMFVKSNGEVQAAVAKQGSATVQFSIHDKNGIDHYIAAASVRFNDTNIDGDAKEIINAIKQELSRRVNDFIKNGNYEDLYNFLKDLAYDSTKSKTGVLRGMGENHALIYGVSLIKQKQDKHGFTFYVNSGNEAINIHNGTGTFSYKLAGEEQFTESVSVKDNEKIIKQLISSILDKAMFNISSDYIKSGKSITRLNGFGNVTSDGKFSIIIPNSDNPDKPLVKTYNSYKEAVINGGLVRTNTKIENGSNYRRKGTKQVYNQTLSVQFQDNTSSPVERYASTSISIQQEQVTNAEQILKDVSITDKAEALLSNVLNSEQLKKLDKLHLLPKYIIFDEKLNTNSDGVWLGDNAIAVIKDNKNRGIKKGQTIVGRRWLDMFNEQGEFAGYEPGIYRAQAIRKLIHEQLHHKLNTKNKQEYLSRIEEIFNDFEKSLENASEQDKINLSKYLFANEDKEVRLEEFLVESLTSEELVNYLNKVDAEFTKDKLKNNIWQRILKVLNDIFGWGIRQGSLREKELYVLQKELGTVREAINQVKTETNNRLNTDDNNTVENVNQENSNTDTDVANTDNQEQTQKEPTKPNMKDLFKKLRSNKPDVRGSSITENIQPFTDEMQNIKQQAIADGTFMKALNGNPTNLNERQWLQVRTKAFKEWFGDWENNSSEASKVVDNNGEPLVVYHGSPNSWTVYDPKQFGTVTDDGYYGKGLYLSSQEDLANSYGNFIKLFVNIRNPFRVGLDPELNIDESTRRGEIVDKFNKPNAPSELAKYDGVLYTGARLYEEIVITDPNQIKSATSNTGEFSITNNDIRHSNITEKPSLHPSIYEFANTLPSVIKANFIASFGHGELLAACK